MKEFLVGFLKTLGVLFLVIAIVFLAMDRLGGFKNLCLLLGIMAINHIVVTGYRFLTTDCDGDPRTGFVGILRVVLFVPMMVLQFLDLVYMVTANLFDTMEEKERLRPGYFKTPNKEKVKRYEKTGE